MQALAAIVTGILIAIAIATTSSHTAQASAKPVQVPLADPAKTLAAQAVFKILPFTPEHLEAGGTGFLVETENNGKVIVTNRHVCEALDVNNRVYYIEQGSSMWIGIQLKKSELTDLCLIQVPLEISRTRTGLRLSQLGEVLLPGERVRVFGHPYLRPLTETAGSYVNEMVEPIGMSVPFDPSKRMLIGRVDFMVFPGNSGSPMLNDRGTVAGIIFAMEGLTRNGLFIPVSELRRFIESND